MLTDVREYIGRMQSEGCTVSEDHDDPILIDLSGRAVDTEQMLVASGVMVSTFWFSVTQSEQRDRPRMTVKSNDKRGARLNALRASLSKVEYDDKDHEVVGRPDPRIVAQGIETVVD
jgi:hypothetical protein